MLGDVAKTSFGALIAHHRERANLTQAALAELIGGISQSMLNLIEHGQRLPRIDDVPRIAHGLGLDPRGLSMFYIRQRHPRVYHLLFGDDVPAVELGGLEPELETEPLDELMIERFRCLPDGPRDVVRLVIDGFWDLLR